MLQGAALALAAAGAQLAGGLACAVSCSRLPRLIRAAADPQDQTPLVLGIHLLRHRSKWMTSRCARGHVYGTILVDIETRRLEPDV